MTKRTPRLRGPRGSRSRHAPLRLLHHDRASLLAGKLHAVPRCPYLKGRDLFDLGWYLSDPGWPPPNLTLLENALAKTGGAPVGGSWRAAVSDRLRGIERDHTVADVRPFLERGDDLALLDRESLLRTLSSSGP